MIPARGSLSGLGVVVTRPAPQAAALARLIEQAGGRPLLYPMIQIEPLAAPGFDAILEGLERFDLAIFISRNAVEHGLSRVAERRPWPGALAVAAVGAGTSAALQARGFKNVIAPRDAGGSESLLQLLSPPAMDVNGKRIAIFRGRGGREHLRRALRARGAAVEYAECYRRAAPQTDVRPLIGEWSRERVHAVAVSSGEALANLAGLLGDAQRARLAATPVFVPHRRVAQAARALGIGQAVISGPADEDVLRALVAYFGHAG